VLWGGHHNVFFETKQPILEVIEVKRVTSIFRKHALRLFQNWPNLAPAYYLQRRVFAFYLY
jgi:hypothetical protein